MANPKIVLCDTNIVIRYFRKDEAIINEMNGLGFERLAISFITAAEMYAGMFKNEQRQTKETLNKFSQYLADRVTIDTFLDLLFTYREQLSIPDALIAVTALVESVELYTDNRQDFEYIKGIQFYRPKYGKPSSVKRVK